MSALEFIAEIAWPVTVLVIALLFRRPIVAILSGEHGSLKAGPFGLAWRRTLSEVKSELGEEAPIAHAAPGPPASDLTTELAPVAARAPTAAVLEAYAQIEKALRQLLEVRGAGEGIDRIGAVGLARRAQETSLITDETRHAVEGLSALRNLAAHGRAEDVSPERAQEYLTLADAVLWAIDANARRAS